jgi:hypothetical protein
LHRTGLDTQQSDSVKSTPSASESSSDTGQLSLFGETCGRLTLNLYATPTGRDSAGPSMRHRDERGTALATQAEIFHSSPPVTPASHSQSPGSDWARKMTATYGRKFADWYLSYGPPDSWVRTLLATSVWASTTCYLTWKKSATPAGRLLFRLVPWMPRTGGTGFGFLHTPRAIYGEHPGMGDLSHLTGQAIERERMWPTPNGDDANKVSRESGQYQSLTRSVQMLPTPLSQEGGASQMYGTKLWEAIGLDSKSKLNSAWVSRMMGYPDGWMDVGEETR